MQQKLGVGAKVYIALVLAFLFLPIVVIVVYSFNSNVVASSADFQGFTLDWYRQLSSDHEIAKSLRTSVVVGLETVVVSLLVGIPAAVVVARTDFPGKRFFNSLKLLPLLLPGILLGIAFMSFYSLLGIPFGDVTLVLAHSTFCIPYVIILVSTRLAGFDHSLVEASRDLGAGTLRTFFSIVMPAVMPAVVSAAALSFVLSFDDVVISFFTAGATSSTLPVLIYSQIKLHPQPTTKALCSLIIGVVSLGVIVVYLIRLYADDRAQRRYARIAAEGARAAAADPWDEVPGTAPGTPDD